MFDITQLFISTAYAQGAALAAPAQGGSISELLGPQAMVFVGILVLFYFLMIRPQQQKLTQHNAMLKKLQKGDQIVTAGGVVGTVFKADDGENIIVEIADNVRVKIVRSTISSVVIKPTV